MSLETIGLLVSYDGTDYQGWQYQPAKTTVQGVLQEALARIHGVPAHSFFIVGSGRTDSGVHALGQVASYHPPTRRAPAVLLNALFHVLPLDIRVLEAWDAAPRFHACRSARGKTYRYRLVNRPFALPFEQRYAWHVRYELDLERMRDAAARLVGRHDFASFATAGGQSKTTVRTLRRLELAERPGAVLELEAEADGFLYRMVRNLTGFLVEVGRGRRPPEDADAALAARRRVAAGMTAPAHGLCLVRVDYEGPIRPGGRE